MGGWSFLVPLSRYIEWKNGRCIWCHIKIKGLFQWIRIYSHKYLLRNHTLHCWFYVVALWYEMEEFAACEHTFPLTTARKSYIWALFLIRQNYDSTYSFLLWNTYLGKTGFCEPVTYWKYYSASIFFIEVSFASIWKLKDNIAPTATDNNCVSW